MPTYPSETSLLLDTHYWLWLQAGELARIGTEASASIVRAAAHESLLLSVISVREVGMLESKGRIALRQPIQAWVDEALLTPGLQLVPLTPEIAVESTRLPGEFHADPADRILVATARLLGVPLLTRDSRIRDYGLGGHVQIS